jgi:hypothetical protein
LSEDVEIETIVVTNHEDFSDNLSEIAFLGSIDDPPKNWITLGELHPGKFVLEHVHEVNMKTNKMIRYLHSKI